MDRDKDVPRLDWWPEETAEACPDPETLATFVDGRLDAKERSRVAGHVAGCSRCHEVFLGIVRFREDEEPGTRPRAAGPWLALAATVAALVVAGLLLRARSSSLPDPGSYLASLPTAAATSDAEPWPVLVFRGPATTDASADSAFEIGVLLVDAQALAARGDAAGARPRFMRLALLLDHAGFVEQEADAFREASRASGEDVRRHAPRIASLARGLGERFDRSDLLLGSWAEAARLAAHAQDASFFAEPRQAAILDAARQRQGLGPETARALTDIAALWPNGRDRPEWTKLAEASSRLIESRVR